MIYRDVGNAIYGANSALPNLLNFPLFWVVWYVGSSYDLVSSVLIPMICSRSPQWPRQRSANAEILGNWKRDEGSIWGAGPKKGRQAFFPIVTMKWSWAQPFLQHKTRLFFDSTSWHRSLFFFLEKIEKTAFSGLPCSSHESRLGCKDISSEEGPAPRESAVDCVGWVGFERLVTTLKFYMRFWAHFLLLAVGSRTVFSCRGNLDFFYKVSIANVGGGGVRQRMFWPFGILIWYRGMLQPSQSLDLLWR